MPGAEERVVLLHRGKVDELESYIPAIYNEKSTLTCEIAAGTANQHNFDLKPQ